MSNYTEAVTATTSPTGPIHEGSFYLEHSPEGDGNPPTAGVTQHRLTGDVIADLTRVISAASEGSGSVSIRTYSPARVLACHEGTRGELLAYLAGLSINL